MKRAIIAASPFMTVSTGVRLINKPKGLLGQLASFLPQAGIHAYCISI
jgi:hypothetical protein